MEGKVFYSGNTDTSGANYYSFVGQINTNKSAKSRKQSGGRKKYRTNRKTRKNKSRS